MKLLRKLRGTFLYNVLQTLPIRYKYLIKNGSLINRNKLEEYLAIAPPLIIKEELKAKPKVGIVIDGIVYKNYVYKNASWLCYERFLRNNNISYDFYDIYSNDWLENSKSFDIIVWHPESTPKDIYIAESKIYVLEKILKKDCFPSFHEIWQYEDKNRASYLYQIVNIPHVPTDTTNSKKEALQILKKKNFPIILKSYIGSGSSGVIKINNYRNGKRIINKIFSTWGYKTVFPYFRLKDTVLIQDFIDDLAYDLRIMIVGEKAFGYYRYPQRGDYRASGSGLIEKKEIPIDAIKLAISIKNKLNSRLLGVDMIYSPKKGKHFIIETSLFNRIDTAEQLMINGVPGYYDISTPNIEFKTGRFWIHELLIQLLVHEWNNKK